MSQIKVSLIAEGLLDEQVLRRLLAQAAPHFLAGTCYGKRGRDWMALNLAKFNEAARIWPYVTLADLEQEECPPDLLRLWFPQGINANMQSRIAVHMVEAWLLADREAIAKFLGISVNRIPIAPDLEPNPKLVMVNLARRSRLRIIREDLVPTAGTTGLVGRNYSGQLGRFVAENWQSSRAQDHSPSLERTIRAIQRFQPILGGS